MYQQSGRAPDDLVSSSRVVEYEPTDAVARSHRAYAYRKMGDYSAAVADYDAALATAPTAVRLYSNRGLYPTLLLPMLLRRRCCGSKQWPDHEPRCHLWGTVCCPCFARRVVLVEKSGRLATVEDLCLVCLLFVRTGYCLARLGLYQDAIADYDRALELEPRNAHAYHNRRGLEPLHAHQFHAAVDHALVSNERAKGETRAHN